MTTDTREALAALVAAYDSHQSNMAEGLGVVSGKRLSDAVESARAALATQPAQPDLHPATADLVRRFSQALAEKLAAAEAKYGYSDGWASPDWMDECRTKLMEHIAKGDPRDVAAYCAFLWHHGASTAPVVEAVPLTDEQIDNIAAHGGARWNGDGWFIEDADFYPLIRTFVAHGIAPKAAQEKT